MSSGRGLRRARTCGRLSGRELRAFAGAKLRPAAPVRVQIQYSKFIIQKLSIGLQPAEESHEADLRDASCGPPQPPGCGPPIAARLIHGKKPAAERTGLRRKGATLRQGGGCGPWKILIETANPDFGLQPAESACDGKEQRASAAPRLRPANRCAVDTRQKARSRADGLATQRSNPPPRGRLRAVENPYRNCKSGFRAAACGERLRRQGAAGLRRREAAARSVLTDRNNSNAAARQSLRG